MEFKRKNNHMQSGLERLREAESNPTNKTKILEDTMRTMVNGLSKTAMN